MTNVCLFCIRQWADGVFSPVRLINRDSRDWRFIDKRKRLEIALMLFTLPCSSRLVWLVRCVASWIVGCRSSTTRSIRITRGSSHEFIDAHSLELNGKLVRLTTSTQQLKITGRQRTVDINIPWLSKCWSSANNLEKNDRISSAQDRLSVAYRHFSAANWLMYSAQKIHETRNTNRVSRIVSSLAFTYAEQGKSAFEYSGVLVLKQWSASKWHENHLVQPTMVQSSWSSKEENDLEEEWRLTWSYHAQVLPITLDSGCCNEWIVHFGLEQRKTEVRERWWFSTRCVSTLVFVCRFYFHFERKRQRDLTTKRLH